MRDTVMAGIVITSCADAGTTL